MVTLRISDVVGIINKIAPYDRAEDWDNVGLQVGDPSASVQRIMVALDGEKPALEAAVASGCQLILTHHPFIFKPLKKISLADPTGERVLMAIRNNLAVI